MTFDIRRCLFLAWPDRETSEYRAVGEEVCKQPCTLRWQKTRAYMRAKWERKVDNDGTLNFLFKHKGGLIAFERYGCASASPNASVNWVGKWRRLLSALGMEARRVGRASSPPCQLQTSPRALSRHIFYETSRSGEKLQSYTKSGLWPV